jgi:PadR family transcriptional regulator, regulatory protein PadR
MVRYTPQVLRILGAFLKNPNEQRYGLDLLKETGLKSGTLYPILLRLEENGIVESDLEDIDPKVEGRSKRRYYTLTMTGMRIAQREFDLALQTWMAPILITS